MSVRRILLLIAGLGTSISMLSTLLYHNFSVKSYENMLKRPASAFTEEINQATVVPSLSPVNITLPCIVDGTSLLAERIVYYEGDFVETGDSSQMVVASGLLLRNIGQKGVLYASVTLERDGEKLTFEVTSLPPGQSALVLEKDGGLCIQENFTSCSGWDLTDDGDWLLSNSISVAAVDSGTLSVTNITDKVAKNVCVYYKTVYEDGLFYIGGITHEVRLEQMAPGETRLLQPKYYASFHSRIVRVTVNAEK